MTRNETHVRRIARRLLGLRVGGLPPSLEARRGRAMSRGLWADIVTAARSTRRSAKLSLAVIMCIGLGTAASSAVLTLYSSTVLRSLPFPDAGRLVRVWLDDPEVGSHQPLSYPDVRDLEEQLTTMDRFVATARSRLVFLGEPGARRVEGEAVTAGYFDLLEIKPFLGRLFRPVDYEAGSEPVMLLSYETWSARYGGDAGILGSTVHTTTRSYTVVGILPPDFLGTVEDDIGELEFWVPMMQDRTEEIRRSRGSGYIWTIGRLAPGVTLVRGREEVRAIGTRIAEANPETRGAMGLEVERFGENWRGDFRSRNYLLLAAACLLLLVAAINAAGLLTSRSLGRRHEMALQAALGAGRARLIRQLLAETSLLAAAGAALGAMVATPALHAFLRLAPEEVPGYVAVTPDVRALGLSLVVLVATALLAGTVPAILGSRVDPAAALRGRGTTAGRRERALGDWLVAGEVALTTLLVVTAGLLLRSYVELSRIDLGFRSQRLLRMTIFVDVSDVDRTEELNAFHSRLRATLLEQPGVEQVGLVWPTLPPGTGGNARIRFADLPESYRAHGLPVQTHRVDSSFLPVMQIPLLAGRYIESGDGVGARRVVVVSRSIADLMGGPERALGQAVEEEGVDYEVVGVVRDVLYFGAVRRRERDFDVYASLAQAPTRIVSMAVATAGDPGRLVGPLSERLNRIAPHSALDWIDPMTVALSGHFEGPRFYLLLVSAFAISALALTAVGIFATLANLVARRMGEFGIRRALGAQRSDVVSAVMRRGLVIAALGLAVGGVGALGVGHLLSRTLYGVGSFDSVTFVATTAVIAAMTALASCLPALRAAGAEPLDALRAQ